MPSIEFWFLIHFINTNKFFGTSRAVIAELVKHIPRFDKSEAFLSNKKWVEDMISDGKLQDAYSRAKPSATSCAVAVAVASLSDGNREDVRFPILLHQ